MPKTSRAERGPAASASSRATSLKALFGSLDNAALNRDHAAAGPTSKRARRAKQQRTSKGATVLPAASAGNIGVDQEQEGATDRSDGQLEPVAGSPKLSPGAKRLLRALCDPATFGASLEELADAAGLSFQQVNNILDQRVFVEAVGSLVRKQLSRSTYQRMQAAVQSALIPGRDGFQDRKMLFEMEGLHTGPVRRHVHEGKIGVEHQVGSRLTRALSLREQVVRQIEQAGEGDDAIIDADYSVEGDDPAPVEGPDDANPLTDMDDAA